MNKTVRKILYIIAFALAIGAFIYLGNLEYGDEKKLLSDSEKFANEYSISKDNPFVYVNSKKVLDLLEGGTGYLLIGFSSDDWTKEYVKYLSEVFSDANIKEVYFGCSKKDAANIGFRDDDIYEFIKGNNKMISLTQMDRDECIKTMQQYEKNNGVIY